MFLDYERSMHPLDKVVTNECIEKYNRLFFFLLKLKRTAYTLHQLWKYLNTPEFRVSSPPLILNSA